MEEIKQGYKQTDIGVIPEDWGVISFGDLVNYTKGYAFKSQDYKKNGVRIIRVSDTTADSIKKENGVYLDNDYAQNFKSWALKEDDLVFSTVGSKPPLYDSMVGKVIVINNEHEGCLLNQNSVLIRSKLRTKRRQQIIYNHFKTKRYIQFIELIYRGNANQASITLKELFEFKIPLPKNENELESIATALSDTDALIAALDKKIAKKQQIKQGAMQQLLTGKKRLSGFSGEWVEIVLGSVCEVKRGQMIVSSEFVKGPIPVIAGGMTPAGYHNLSNRNENTITISASGANAGFIGFHKSPIFASDCSTINENENIDIHFIYYTLKLKQEEIYNSQTGGAQPHIHPKDIEPLILNFPIDKSEQTAIAQILTDMDNV